jgi:hypothetical protein
MYLILQGVKVADDPKPMHSSSMLLTNILGVEVDSNPVYSIPDTEELRQSILEDAPPELQSKLMAEPDLFNEKVQIVQTVLNSNGTRADSRFRGYDYVVNLISQEGEHIAHNIVAFFRSLEKANQYVVNLTDLIANHDRAQVLNVSQFTDDHCDDTTKSNDDKYLIS